LLGPPDPDAPGPAADPAPVAPGGAARWGGDGRESLSHPPAMPQASRRRMIREDPPDLADDRRKSRPR